MGHKTLLYLNLVLIDYQKYGSSCFHPKNVVLSRLNSSFRLELYKKRMIFTKGDIIYYSWVLQTYIKCFLVCLRVVKINTEAVFAQKCPFFIEKSLFFVIEHQKVEDLRESQLKIT